MPSQVSSPTVNSNGLLPSTRMPPLTSGHPIKVENNTRMGQVAVVTHTGKACQVATRRN